MRQGAHGSRTLHVALAASLVVAAVLAAIPALTPGTDVAGTRIAIGELRSRAAALALVAREGGDGHLTDTYLRMQATQLADRIGSAQDALGKAPAAAANEARAAQARVPALVARAQALAQGPGADRLPDLRDALLRTSDGLRRLERALAGR